jgi:transcriptional regulator with XRE-family HTH domain
MSTLPDTGRQARSNGIQGQPSAAFGTTLRQCRIEAGLTQEELANRSGISIRAISDLERNRTTKPLMRSARMLADALKLSGDARDEFAEAAIRDAGKQSHAVSRDAEPSPRIDCYPAPSCQRCSVIPRQLPASLKGLTGRDDAVAALDALLDAAWSNAQQMPIVVIGGIVGAGKTALAVYWARAAAARFPDGQLYVDMGGFSEADRRVSAADALDGFLCGLAVPVHQRPTRLADKAAIYRSIVAGKRLLIVLDNARDAEHVRPLLPGSGTCLTLVTSRDELTGLAGTHGAVTMSLDMLSSQAAHDYLAGRLGRERVNAEAHAARELIERCAGLPLALSITAACAAARPRKPLAAIARGLRTRPEILDAFAMGDPACDLRSAVSWSYLSLDGQAARLFRLFGLHPGQEIGVRAAASLAGITPDCARRLCDQLIRAGLLREAGADSYVCHELLRAYATELADPADAVAVVGASDKCARWSEPGRQCVSCLTTTPSSRSAGTYPNFLES